MDIACRIINIESVSMITFTNLSNFWEELKHIPLGRLQRHLQQVGKIAENCKYWWKKNNMTSKDHSGEILILRWTYQKSNWHLICENSPLVPFRISFRLHSFFFVLESPAQMTLTKMRTYPIKRKGQHSHKCSLLSVLRVYVRFNLKLMLTLPRSSCTFTPTNSCQHPCLSSIKQGYS